MFLHRVAVRNPPATVFLFLACLLAASAGLPRLRSLLKIEDVLDPASRQARLIHELNETYYLGNTSAFLLAPPPGRDFTPAELCRVRHWLSNVKLVTPDLLQAMSTFDLRTAEAQNGKLIYPYYLDLRCDDGVATGFEALQSSPYAGTLVSKTARDLFFQLSFVNAPEDGRFGTFDPDQVTMLHASLAHDVTSEIPGLRVLPLGEADFQLRMLEGIQGDGLLNLLVVIALILLLRAGFGTWRAGLVFVFTLVVTTLGLFGLMGWLGGPLDVLTNCLFPMMAVAALEDFVFLAHDRLERAHQTPLETFAAFVTPAFFTSLTTAIGFFSLCAVPEPVIARFGLWAGVGAALEYAAMFWLLPALVALFPALGRLTNPEKRWLPLSLYRIHGARLPRFATRALLLVLPLALFAGTKLSVHDSPLALFPRGNPIREAAAYAKETRGWETSVDLVFTETATRELHDRALAELRNDPVVAAAQDVDEILSALTRGKPALTADLIRREVLRTNVFRQMQTESGRKRTTLFVRDSDSRALFPLRESVKRLCPEGECYLTGTIIAYADFTERIPAVLLESFLTSIVLVLLVIFFLAWQTGARHWIPLTVSCLWGPAFMLLLAVTFRLPVNLMTCMFASVLVGLTGDNAIQFLLGRADLETGIEARGGASLLCSSMMALTALLFCLSRFEPPHLFGVLLALGLLSCTFGDIWLLKGLLKAPRKPPRKA